MRHASRDEGVSSFHEVLSDGLLDIFFGLLVAMLVGIAALRDAAVITREPVVGMIVLVLALLALAMGFEFARRHITYRRIGHAFQTGDLSRREALVMFVILLSLLVGAGLPFVLARVPTLAEGYFVPVLLTGVVTLVSGTVALAFASPRFWIYAALFGLPILLQQALTEAGLPSSLEFWFGVGAFVAIVIGSVLLVRFVRQHPLPEHAPMTPAHI